MSKEIVLRVQPSVSMPWAVHDSDLFEEHQTIKSSGQMSRNVMHKVVGVKTLDGVDEQEHVFSTDADNDLESVLMAKHRLLESYKAFVDAEIYRITRLASEDIELAEKSLVKEFEKLNGQGI